MVITRLFHNLAFAFEEVRKRSEKFGLFRGFILYQFVLHLLDVRFNCCLLIIGNVRLSSLHEILNVSNAHSTDSFSFMPIYVQDLPRTFPGHTWLDTPEGQGALRRVLVGYSFRDSDVGYCQVMFHSFSLQFDQR